MLKFLIKQRNDSRHDVWRRVRSFVALFERKRRQAVNILLQCVRSVLR